MRKILLATTAVVAVAVAGAANAASTSPISLNVGGYTDFVGGLFHESQGTVSGATRANSGFETEYKLNFDAVGKASNGVEYGANVSIWNGPEISNLWAGGGTTAELNSAYVWLSGAFGKALFGDEHGASDLQVYAPTVGEGQIDGRYLDFVSPGTLARVYASGIDNTEHGTKVTYYTPKVGNDVSKVQLGVSYEPNQYNYGSGIDKTQAAAAVPGIIGSTTLSPYKNKVDGAAKYWGNYNPITIAASLNISTASAGATGASKPALFANAPNGGFQDYTSWGLGTQIGFTQLAGFTLGGSYQDLGRYGTVTGQSKNQDVWTFGGKYEFDKVAVAANYITSSQYDNLLGSPTVSSRANGINYVGSFNAYGAGATYTWFPGLSTAADAVFFDQKVDNVADKDQGYVLLVSQKLTF